jgi:isoleucyl-tRNA synthetase
VRLWVASQDYRNDIVVSEERINKVAETYRGIRNCLRYQLSNLYDFDPAKHTVADEKLTGLDRWILSKFSELEHEVIAAYDAYEFHVVYQKISQFVAVELSSIYHDVVKDRLYTDAANSHRRRSTQTTLHRLVTGLCKILAPILAFTADEAWAYLPLAEQRNSVHGQHWSPIALELADNEIGRWISHFQLRENVLAELEKQRQMKAIGKSLDAKVILNAFLPGTLEPQISLARNHLLEVKELLNSSQLEIKSEHEIAGGSPEILVLHADGQKCERCWHWETDVGSNPEHPTICSRCVEAIKVHAG